jgi:hypothetical protein
MPDRPSLAEAVAWAGVVTVAERSLRGVASSRSMALLTAYVPLGLAATARGRGRGAGRAGTRGGAVGGLVLAFGGYQAGRWLLDDAPDREPPDAFVSELVTLGVVVPLAEEAIWGSRVEPRFGVAATAAAFALKHPVVDRRWRRTLGLALFWTGLGLIRRRTRAGAALAHVVANSGAVVLGHATRRDRF